MKEPVDASVLGKEIFLSVQGAFCRRKATNPG